MIYKIKQNKSYISSIKQRFKYLKNEKNKFIKVILKLECLFDRNIYLLFHLILYSWSYFDPKKGLIEKRHPNC